MMVGYDVKLNLSFPMNEKKNNAKTDERGWQEKNLDTSHSIES